MCASPRLFAAYRVLLRPPVPGHSPCALFRLTLHCCSLCLPPFSRLQTVFPRSSIFRCLFFSYLLLALLYMRFSRCVEVFPASPRADFLFLFWRPPILPHRLQCSTFGRLRLNRRVRDGNGCFPQSYRRQIFELLIAQQ